MYGLLSSRACFLLDSVELSLGSHLFSANPWMIPSSLECAFSRYVALSLGFGDLGGGPMLILSCFCCGSRDDLSEGA